MTDCLLGVALVSRTTLLPLLSITRYSYLIISLPPASFSHFGLLASSFSEMEAAAAS